MVSEISGDLLQVEVGIIGHQTNFYGVMGAGVALAIQRKLLTGYEYRKYENICRQTGRTLLGSVQILQANDGRYVANIFSQDDVIKNGTLTDYEALRKGLKFLNEYAATQGVSVALPAGIGCGIAGGDWRIVRGIIYEVFGESDVECIIVKKS